MPDDFIYTEDQHGNVLRGEREYCLVKERRCGGDVENHRGRGGGRRWRDKEGRDKADVVIKPPEWPGEPSMNWRSSRKLFVLRELINASLRTPLTDCGRNKSDSSGT